MASIPNIGAVLGGLNNELNKASILTSEISAGFDLIHLDLLPVGKVLGGFTSALGPLVMQASKFEQAMFQTSLAVGMTSGQLARLRENMAALSVPERTNQSMDQLLAGFEALTAVGLTSQEASDRLEAVGRAASASALPMEEFATTTATLTKSLGLQPSELKGALSQLSVASENGNVHLKSMLDAFPELGEAASKMGLTGSTAVNAIGAAFGIVAADSTKPEEAAANLKTLMDAAVSPKTLENFRRHGINLKNVMADAVKNGESPLDALLVTTRKLTGGDKAEIGQLFADSKAVEALTPLLAKMDEYNALKAKMSAGSGAIDENFARAMETSGAQLTAFSNSLNKLGTAVGASILPAFTAVLQAINPVVSLLANVATASPTTTAAVIGIATAFTVLPKFLMAARVAIANVGIAIKLMGVAMRANPIGLLISALVIGAALLIDNWDAVKSFFATLWDGILENWRTILTFIGPIGWMAIKIIDNFDAIRAAALSIWDGVTAKWGELVDAVAPIGEAISGIWDMTWGKITGIWDAGAAYIMGLWDKIREPLTNFAKFMGWIAPDGADGTADANANPPTAANSNLPAANSNRPQPGSAIAAAEVKGSQIAAQSANGKDGTAGMDGGRGVQQIELTLVLPSGVGIAVNKPNPNVKITARTGDLMRTVS